MTQTWKNSDFEAGTVGHVWVHFCAKTTCLLPKEKILALATAKNRYISLKYSAPRLWCHPRNSGNIINRE